MWLSSRLASALARDPGLSAISMSIAGPYLDAQPAMARAMVIAPVRGLAAAAIPLWSYQAALPKKAIHLIGIADGVKRQQIAQREIGGRLVAAPGRTVATPERNEASPIRCRKYRL